MAEIVSRAKNHVPDAGLARHLGHLARDERAHPFDKHFASLVGEKSRCTIIEKTEPMRSPSKLEISPSC